MSDIQKLRELGDCDGTTSYYSERDERLETLELLDCYNAIQTEFEDYGRWSNYKTEIFKIEENGEVAYFEFGMEKPATEMQEGQDCSWHFKEVFPKEVTTIIYVGKDEL